MVSQFVNEFDCIKHCWGVYKQHSNVNSVRVDDWTAKLAIIASNVMSLKNVLKEFQKSFKGYGNKDKWTYLGWLFLFLLFKEIIFMTFAVPHLWQELNHILEFRKSLNASFKKNSISSLNSSLKKTQCIKAGELIQLLLTHSFFTHARNTIL